MSGVVVSWAATDGCVDHGAVVDHVWRARRVEPTTAPFSPTTKPSLSPPHPQQDAAATVESLDKGVC